MGAGGEKLHEWAFATRTFRQMFGSAGGDPGSDEGIDDRFAAQADVGIGATIMGRNMFGPTKGPWPDDGWKGWWGDEPPYHHQVFVLTHHPRASFAMRGGTTFHFVTDTDPNRVLGRALDAAAGRDVRIAGGPSTVQQFMRRA